MNGIYLPTDYKNATPIKIGMCEKLTNLTENYFDQRNHRTWPVEVHQALKVVFAGGEKQLAYVNSYLYVEPAVSVMEVRATYRLSVSFGGKILIGNGSGKSGYTYNEAVMLAVERAIYDLYLQVK